jgi:hypothetical protein
MTKLIEVLEKLKKVSIILVYLAKAHADDVWPLGFGVNQPKTLDERWANCEQMLSRQSALRSNLDSVFVDNMNNEFLKKTGAWPEKYMFADRDGKCIWKNEIEPERI